MAFATAVLALPTLSPLAAAQIASTGGPPHLGLNLSQCVVGTSKLSARCGTFVVYEDRAAASGRTIAIPLVVIPAKHPNKQGIFWNPGGPGAGAADFADVLADGKSAPELLALNDQYDIVLANNRGVGGPNAQQCDVAPPEHPQVYFLQMWPDDLLKECRARLASGANLDLYTSSISADDFDDLRAALGYPKIVLDGVSYGTYFFLVYMRQHPDHVSSAILDGVAPPAIVKIPLEMAGGAQVAMDRLVAACAADNDCATRFPQFGTHFAALVRRFDSGPIRVPLASKAGEKPNEVLLSKEIFAERLRQTLYEGGSAAYVPYIIERAYAEDYAPLALMVDTITRQLDGLVALGLNLSVTCAEDVPFIEEGAIQRSTRGSFEGDLRIRAQQRACKIWNVKRVPASFNTPVRSDAPVLMLSGTNDPASPPEYAEQELRYLPNARRVLVQGAAHAEQTECTNRLKIEFVRAGSAQGLDLSSCRSAFRRPAFATSMTGFGGG